MSLYVSIIGIDGSGKSTVTSALADLVAAELGVTVATVGDDFRCKTPEEDLLLPGFAPDGEIWAARLDQWFRKAAKAAVAHRRLYPPLKLAQLIMQEQTARQIEAIYQPDVIFCDGNLLLSSAGRVINYMDSQTDPASLAASLDALYHYVVEGKPLPPTTVQSIPCLKWMRWLRWLDERLDLGLMELPDALIFLDVAPTTALARLRAHGQKLDRHENLHDLTQAQAMYQRVVEFFQRRRGERNAAVIDVTGLSVGQTLQQVLDFVHRLPLRPLPSPTKGGKKQRRLGAPDREMQNVSAVVKKALTCRFLIRYTLPNLHQGSAHELAFPLSQLGRLLLREGYSARVMKSIYLQDSRRYHLLDQVFLAYPLHRAVYHRLQILKRAVEREFWYRLERLPIGGTIKVMTAPSGYAFDLLQPLEHIARAGRERVKPIHIFASDLDPDGHIEAELSQAARRLGLSFEFVRGDLTSAEMREKFKRAGPYDVVLFVGLSCWIPKPHLVNHLKLIHQHLLAPGGVLFTDCFTPHAFALSGKHIGYKANYYSPQEFASILAYCGFDLADITQESGPEGINHVCVARAQPGPRIASVFTRKVLRFPLAQVSGAHHLLTHRLHWHWREVSLQARV